MTKNADNLEKYNLSARLKTFKKNIRESSIKTYVANIKRLKKIHTGSSAITEAPSTTNWLNSDIIKTLKELPLKSAKLLTPALLVLLQMTEQDDLYAKIKNQYTDIVIAANNMKSNTLTPSERKNWLTFQQLEQLRDMVQREFGGISGLKSTIKIRKSQWNSLLFLQYLCLVTYMPPFRSENYATFRTVKQNDLAKTGDIYIYSNIYMYIYLAPALRTFL